MFLVIDLNGNRNATTKKFNKALSFVQRAFEEEGKTVGQAVEYFNREGKLTRVLVYPFEGVSAEFEIVVADKIKAKESNNELGL